VGGHAQTPHYRYVSLDQIALPTGFTVFFPGAVQDSGRLYGEICDTALCNVNEFVYVQDGKMTVLLPVPPESFLDAVNTHGTLGASILVDPVNGIFQAALIQGGSIKLIPPQPGEIAGLVIALNDNDTALVQSFTTSGIVYVLYHDGTVTPINFGLPLGFLVGMNANGIIAGTEGQSFFNGGRGFRFDTRNSNAMILDPFAGDPTEINSSAQGIDQAGNVLGYSFTGSRPYHERIGIWGSNGVFYTYFVESIDTGHLLFNENHLIVITAVEASNVSYLVPQPGVRLNLADLVVNLPVGQDLAAIYGLNNHGDILGSSSTGANFLLQRLNDGDRETYETPVVNNVRRAIHPGVAIMRSLLPRPFK
jgi:hypothetical protein